MLKRFALCTALAALVLSGCDGGGSALAPLAAGAIAPNTPRPTASPTPTLKPTPTPTPAPTPGQLAAAPTAIAIGATNPSTATITATETNYAGPIAQTNTCNGIAFIATGQSSTSTASNGYTYSQQFNVSQTAAGSCTVTVADNHGGTVAIAITSTTFGTLAASAANVSIGNGAPTSATVAISEANYPRAFTESDNCNGIATVALSSSTGPTTSATISQLAAGTCTANIADDHGGSVAIAITSTTSSVVIQSHGGKQ